ncbi:MAG TPA: hypothetical protein VK803_00725 [Steroidobacteraceae bacterium]|nr:hypothetical protein [Steroidobacteraceae bacterium]
MRFRLTAFGLHLAGSACALTLILGGLYLGWYRGPGWYLSGVAKVVLVLAVVDVALGPTLTLIIANPAKPRRELARDIGMIVIVQIAALVYGTLTLWGGRPLYYTFSSDRLEMVQASDLKPPEVALARQQNPALAPHWYSLPRWVWAPLPDDPNAATNIVNSTIFGGGQDVIDMPRYFKPWSEGLGELRKQLTTVDEMKQLSLAQKQTVKARMAAAGLDPGQRNALLMWGDVRKLLVVFDPQSARIRARLRLD